MDLSDPLQVAVEVTTVKGTLALLQQQVSIGLTNLSSQMAAIQAEQHASTKVIAEVARQQQAMETQSEGLSRAFIAIERVADEFARWREPHELANRNVADRMTTFQGVLIGFGLLAATVVGLAALSVQQGFRRADENLAAYVIRSAEYRTTIDRRLDHLEAQRNEPLEARRQK